MLSFAALAHLFLQLGIALLQIPREAADFQVRGHASHDFLCLERLRDIVHCAYAESGDLDAAVERQEEALALSEDDESRETARALLEFYQRKQAARARNRAPARR